MQIDGLLSHTKDRIKNSLRFMRSPCPSLLIMTPQPWVWLQKTAIKIYRADAHTPSLSRPRYPVWSTPPERFS
jgi:hypothetical protein